MRSTSLLFVLLLTCANAMAQVAQVRVSAGPYYVGVAIDIEVTVEGFERSPEPTIEAQTAPGAVLELASVSPNFSSSIQIINGQMTRSESARFVYRYRLLSETTGSRDVGPFLISQGAGKASAQAVRFQIEELPTADKQRFRLVLPEHTLWVGQRLPVKLEWWLTESFAQRLSGRRARVPLFDHIEFFSFEDLQVANAKNKLVVDTHAGELQLPATVERRDWRGESYLVVTVERSMTALKSGDITIEPASIVSEEATSWSTDFFGNKVPRSVRRLRVLDEKRTLSFKTPPSQGRPASFAGAIGKGFSISVTADRSVVQTGDPIALTIEVRGDTTLEAVSLPRLADSGFDTQYFNAPQGPVGGIIENGVKRFEVMLRVNSEQVDEIPPIAFSWFDPELGKYQTTHSRPIAVSVRAATIVSAADVVRAESVGDEQKTDQGEAGLASVDSARSPRARTKRAFTLSGADLAIETRREVLLLDPTPWYARPSSLGTVYFGGVLALGIAFAARRRADVDQMVRKRRRTLVADRQIVVRAPSAGEVASALRRMAATALPAPRSEYDAVLIECDNLAYAPGTGENATVESQLRRRALAVADSMLEAGQ